MPHTVRNPATGELVGEVRHAAPIDVADAIASATRWDAPVAERNIVGIIQKNPDLARAGIRLRQFGQEPFELLLHAACLAFGDFLLTFAVFQ